MNKIYIETSIGDLLDKITILEIKMNKIKDKDSLNEINKEYSSLQETLKKDVNMNEEILTLVKELKKTNLSLWDIEDKLRVSEKNKKFDQNFISLARSVYINNDNRAKFKLKINQLSGSNIKEIKSFQRCFC